MTRTKQRTDFVLAASCLLLVSVFVYETVAPLPVPELPQVAPPALPPPPHATPFNPPPQATFAAIDARPIFNPDRQPIESTATAGNTATTAPPDVTLIGVILSGKDQLALVKREGAPFADSIAVGGVLDGWEVADIAGDHVLLRSAGHEYTLRMDAKRASQPSLPVARGTTQNATAPNQTPIYGAGDTARLPTQQTGPN